jgi:protein-S-isoprenylcysteine O-methyltransferase Ste14
MKDTRFAVVLTLQLLAALALLAIIVFREGEWNRVRWIGLIIALPAMVLLFVARYQLGKSFSLTPQARDLVTHGLYSKIRNPIYVFGGLMVLGFLIALQKKRSKGTGSPVRGRIPGVQKNDLALTEVGCQFFRSAQD